MRSLQTQNNGNSCFISPRASASCSVYICPAVSNLCSGCFPPDPAPGRGGAWGARCPRPGTAPPAAPHARLGRWPASANPSHNECHNDRKRHNKYINKGKNSWEGERVQPLLRRRRAAPWWDPTRAWSQEPSWIGRELISGSGVDQDESQSMQDPCASPFGTNSSSPSPVLFIYLFSLRKPLHSFPS